MNEFDVKAATWDENPLRAERARAAAQVIKSNISISNQMTALEYGCGTGLLSFNLYENLKDILLVDSSEGMLSVLNDKIHLHNVSNMKTLKSDFTENVKFSEKFDLIYSLMTMHHIVEIDKTIKKFFDLINPSGYLCIADLDEEDGSFHGEGFIGHNGFNRAFLSGCLEQHGFTVIHYEICFVVEKQIENSIRKYPVFVMIAQKK